VRFVVCEEKSKVCVCFIGELSVTPLRREKRYWMDCHGSIMIELLSFG
jgi:hypothetical protein